MLSFRAMHIPPADLVYLRDQFSDLAAQIQDHWELSAAAEGAKEPPSVLSDAMAQLINMLGLVNQDTSAGGARRSDINTLGEYGMHLIDELAASAQTSGQASLARDVEQLALPFALWLSRNDAELRSLANIVDPIAQFANKANQPQQMASLYSCCCELIEAASPACEEERLSDGRRPWQLLLLNRAIVATRSLNPDLIASAFDSIVELLPEEAHGFFAEGMEQMAINDYPDHVRDIMQRYFVAHASPRRLH